MRYAVDYAAMNNHRLWLKGFASGVSRLNSHSIIRLLRITPPSTSQPLAAAWMQRAEGNRTFRTTGDGGKRSAAR
ncbi:hypothetical protein ACVXHA_01245 [Escherichia coli]